MRRVVCTLCQENMNGFVPKLVSRIFFVGYSLNAVVFMLVCCIVCVETCKAEICSYQKKVCDFCVAL